MAAPIRMPGAGDAEGVSLVARQDSPRVRPPYRVLYVSPNARLGGAEQSLCQWLRLHDRARCEPYVYLLNDGPLAEVLQKEATHCEISPGSPPRLRQAGSVLKSAWRISRYARERGIHLIHSVMGYGHIFGGIAARMAGIPEVWYQHGPTGRLDWLTGRIPTSTLIVNSEYTRSRQSRYRAWAERTRLIYPGTEAPEPSAFSEIRSRMRERYRLGSDQVVFGLLARISPMKGHDLFLRAAALVLKEHPSARFLIVGTAFLPGDRDYELRMKALAAELGVSEQVIFTGFVDQGQFDVISACDAVVNASTLPEPFGLTVIEAMAMEKPAIGPALAGPAESILDGVDGLLFRPGNERDLADRMLRLARSAELRNALGRAGRNKVLDRFHIQRVVQELEEEYDLILSGR